MPHLQAQDAGLASVRFGAWAKAVKSRTSSLPYIGIALAPGLAMDTPIPDDAMFRIRFHGRGGQGVKTASRILGSALFRAGFEVQDAPRYGAERRGAPIFAYVRAAKRPIEERGIILEPDLVVVVDDSVVPIPAAGVVVGLSPETMMLMHTAVTAERWRERLTLGCRLVTMAPTEDEGKLDAGMRLTGAAARLLGVISEDDLAGAIADELGGRGGNAVERGLRVAKAAFDAMTPHAGAVKASVPRGAESYTPPAWIELSAEPSAMSTPAIHAPLTSEKQPTGLWRTTRPEIDEERCHRCTWLCGSFCPDGAIRVDAEGYPVIDYEHCKGCMICAAQCPHHAIEIVAEHAEANP
jgi:pyruvate ferredoxin oxidoreductase gamma subunit